MKRKEFIDNIFRYGIIGGLVLLFGFLLLKREVKTSGSSCPENLVCKSCKKNSTCNLPEKS